MFGLSFSEIFVMGIMLVPLVLLVAGFAFLAGYIVYLLLQRTFSHDFHLTHRKAH